MVDHPVESAPQGAVEPDAEPAADELMHVLAAHRGQTADAFRAASNLNELLKAATRQVRRVVDAERVRIWVARRGGMRLETREFGPGDAPPVQVRIPRGEGLAGWCLEQGQPLRLGAKDARPALRGRVPSFRSALVVPLFRRGEAFGVIECLDRRDGQDFTVADLEHLDVTSEQVAFALDNALLFEETERRALEKEVLLEVSRTLSAPLDLEEVFEAIFRGLREVVSFDGAAIYLVNRTTQALEPVAAIGYPEGSEEAFRLQVGQGIVGWVAKTGEPLIVPDVKRDRRYIAARPQTRSELAAPLILEGRTLGVFNLERDLEDAYHDGHLELLMAFASQAAVAIERARLTRELLERRRLEKELAIAREIQLSFLPAAPPVLPGFDLAGATRPHDQVGGDYYDFIQISDSRMGLAIADVSGKGIPAALLMAGFRMSLLAEIRNEFAIRAVMRKVNTLLHESTERDRFVTTFYGVLDFRNSVLIFSNAGHDPPILLRAAGGTELLIEGGVALGVLPDARYDERPVALLPGDVVVFYTDGISEAESASGEQFGTRRLEDVARAHMDRTAEQILAAVEKAVVDWAGERGPSDDLTLVVLKARTDSKAGSPRK